MDIAPACRRRDVWRHFALSMTLSSSVILQVAEDIGVARRSVSSVQSSARMNTLNSFNADVTVCHHGLGVALSCYISHSAMHKKKADFDPPGGQNP